MIQHLLPLALEAATFAALYVWRTLRLETYP